MDLAQIWQAIGPAGQAVCTGAASGFFGDLAGEAWRTLTGNTQARVLGTVYQKWRDGLLDSVEDRPLGQAFAEFFGRADTRAEMGKILDGRYAEADVRVLERAVLASCDFAQCPLPDADLYSFLETMIEGLVEALPEQQAGFSTTLEALRGQREPGQPNYSLARRAYFAKLREEHRLIPLRGFDTVNDLMDVELERVFVMPRITAHQERESEPFPAEQVWERYRDKGIVILGGPGSGKTTLLSRFALDLAAEKPGMPRLFPVFYRLREYQKDREEHRGNRLLECLHARWAAEHNLRLPLGFFRRQERDGGLAVLLDGLDEVPSEDKRIALVHSISQFALDLPSGSVVIVTSRPHEYERNPFASDRCRHFTLTEFDDDEIRKFIQGWRAVHEAAPGAVRKATRDLWDALKAQPPIRKLAGNALLLTMIVRVHWWLGQLPESRLQLYKTCADALLYHWSVVKGLKFEGIGLEQTREFLSELAYAMQAAAGPEEMKGEPSLQLPKTGLRKRLEKFLERKRLDAALLDPLIERLYTRDAILVNFGGDRFGFVHRSFQEYFAACWLAQEKGPDEIRGRLDHDGWNETLYLAVAQLAAREQRQMLLRLLKEGRAGFALGCVQASSQQTGWLAGLVRFLAKYTLEGRDFSGLSATECLPREENERRETSEILASLFEPALRDGQVLAAAVELAELVAPELVRSFLLEASQSGEDMVVVGAGRFLYGSEKRQVTLEEFRMDRHPVTNVEFERMVPGHRRKRDRYSSGDDQPVIYVNWYEARLYARRRGCRLPTEQEWEKAASWDPKRSVQREYPWGDKFDKSRCNTWESGLRKTTARGAYPQGRSADGCEDMAGNVWEWTESLYRKGGERNVVRGGSWSGDSEVARCASRISVRPHLSHNDCGFRCART